MRWGTVMSRELYQRIYLSPHLDDAVLSCGGTIYQQRRASLSVLVVTLMAGDATPEAADTPYVTGLHTRWGLSATSNPSMARRAEDREALDILQADALHWEWPDCIYRRHVETGEFLYHSEEALFGQVHPTEQGMVAQLAQRLSGLPLAPGGRVYAPLTVGGHVDHELVREAAEDWGAPGGNLVYYEDYPYAEHPEALGAILGDGVWRSELELLGEETMVAKTTAVACYRSQLSTFFMDTEELAARLRAYATVVGEGKAWAERYWHRD